MDKKELEEGLNAAAIASAMEGAADAPPAWEPSMDWVMKSVGPFFNNNAGLGELLLDKLKESGINTEGVALAGLVNVLQQFSQEYKALGEAVGQNLDKINSLSDQSEDLAQAIQDVLKEMDVPKDAGGENPADNEVGDIAMGAMENGDMGGAPPPDMGAGGDMGAMGGMAPDMGAEGGMGAEPPPDMGAEGGMGAPPPDMGAEGGMGAPPPDMGAGGDMGAPPPDMGQVSDAREKRVLGYTPSELHGVLSDARAKRVAKSIVDKARHKKNFTKMNGNIIDSCMGGF